MGKNKKRKNNGIVLKKIIINLGVKIVTKSYNKSQLYDLYNANCMIFIVYQ